MLKDEKEMKNLKLLKAFLNEIRTKEKPGKFL
jgi:hypothetical protein